MTDNHGVVVTGSDPCAELLAVFWFKVFLGCDEDISRGIKTEELRRPLFRKMVGNCEKRLLAKAEPLAFHRRRDHFERLAGAHFVCKQGVAAI